MYFYCYVYVFLLLCMFRSVYCLCVNVYCTAATGCQPNCSKQIYIYHIISYHIKNNKHFFTDGGDVSRCTSRPAQAVTVSL
jgi:hypothetical protein